MSLPTTTIEGQIPATINEEGEIALTLPVEFRPEHLTMMGFKTASESVGIVFRAYPDGSLTVSRTVLDVQP